MNCSQCGAPMTLYRERDYYHCEHCGRYHFPDSSADGLRVLGENLERIMCPLCQIPLNMVTVDDFYRGYICSNCQGLIFKRTTFRDAIDSRRAKTKLPSEPANRFNPEELKRDVFCPLCKVEMGTYHYLGPGNIIIDTCHDSDLIWLDYGELNKIVNAPGKDRGVPRVKPDQLEEEEKGKPQKKRTAFEQGLVDLLDKLFSQG